MPGRGRGAAGAVVRALPYFEGAPQNVSSIDSLEELCDWLGTFRERLRLASAHEREAVRVTVDSLEQRYRQRRAELS